MSVSPTSDPGPRPPAPGGEAAPAYVELHCHSCYSLREGASTPVELIERAIELGYDTLALTDHDGLYGSMEFAREATERGVRPITGAEVTLDDGSHLTLLVESAAGFAQLCRLISARLGYGGAGEQPDRQRDNRIRAEGTTANSESGEEKTTKQPNDHLSRREHPRREERPHPRPLSPIGERGALSDRAGVSARRHVTAARTGQPRHVVPPSPEFGRGVGGEGESPLEGAGALPHTGLIALTGCPQGEIPTLIARGDLAGAETAARRLIRRFGRENVFVELQQNRVYGDTARNAALVALAERVGVGVVATNNVHYHVRERGRLHDVLVAIRHRLTLDASHRQRRANREFSLKGPEEMAQLFAAYPEAIANSARIAERCARFNLARDLAYSFPDYDVPPEHGDANGFLAAVCYEAIGRHYDFAETRLREDAEARLQQELTLIRKHGLAGFFLTYRDILALAGEIAHELHGRDPELPPDVRPVGRGRGSSVSSIVCYLIGLSHVDPVRNKLFLGRFLNEELASVPDIDLDFPRDIRAALIERMYDRYPGRVGLVCILPTYRLRSAVRDIGKVLGLPQAELEKLAKLAGGYADARTLAEEMRRLPEFAGRVDAPLWRDLISLCGEIAGFPRHVSQHVGGMVLSAGPINEVVPVEPAKMPGRWLIQWDKDSADDARFVKIDFLALGMLSLVDECLDTIEARHGRRIEFSREGYEDAQVYQQICEADTAGVFQIESRAQMQTLPHTQPRNIDDLAVEVAIVRPGPIVGGAFRPYMNYRRQHLVAGDEGVHYDHDLLRPVLEETLGVILFQEQVLQVAMAIAGFSAGQAESLRRSMSRHRSHEAMAAHWPQFRLGAAERGVDEATARTIFDKLLGFAQFGFPKSHAVAFARLAYESAWLRHYYFAEFYAALFNNQPMGFYSLGVLAGDAKRHGVAVLPPAINVSGARCTVESDEAIRLGYGRVREIGGPLAELIVAEQGRAPFRSLFDFVQRTGIGRTAAENLIAVGTFDAFGLERRELLWQLGLFAGVGGRSARPAKGPSEGRQAALPLSVEGDAVSLRPLSAWERLVADHHALDFSPATHPLALMRRWLGEGIATSKHVEKMQDQQRVRTAGMVVCRQRPGSAKGVLFLLLEDEYGLVNVIVYPDLYDRQRLAIKAQPFIVVDGILQRQGPTFSLLAQSVTPLRPPPDLVAPSPRDFH